MLRGGSEEDTSHEYTIPASLKSSNICDSIINIFLFIFSPDIARSLDVLDQVIGEFDDGFLSDADTVRSINKRKDPRGQFGFSDKIDQIFDEIYEDSKVERLDNFKISSGPDKGAAAADEKTPSTEIPAPGTVQAAKRQYLDNLDRSHLDRDRERSRIADSKVHRDARGQASSDTRHGEKTRKSETNVVRREKSGRGGGGESGGTFVSETGAGPGIGPHQAGSAATQCQVGSDHLLPTVC